MFSNPIFSRRQDEFDFKKSAIIEPPSEHKKDTRSAYVVIDSRDRDMNIFKSSSKYVIEFDDPYRDVVSAELISARLPLSSYNVDEYNSSFSISSGGFVVNVSLEKGLYSHAEIVDKISNIITPHGYSISYDTSSLKFSFTNSLDFVLDFSSQFSCGTVLGFRSNAGKISSVNNKIVAPYPAFLERCCRNYAIMIIDSFNNLKSQNNATNNAFALIDQEECNNSGENNTIAKKYFNPPLNEISSLKIRFVDYMNQPYDFSEKDHYFVLRLECLKNGRLYH